MINIDDEIGYLKTWSSEEKKTAFNEEMILNLRSFFNRLDQDKDGTLSKDEFKVFLQERNVDTRFLDAIFFIFDKNRDKYQEPIKDFSKQKGEEESAAQRYRKEKGELTFDRFLAFIDACIQTEKYPTYFFKLIFDSVDKDGNGAIDIHEMKEFTELCGQPLSEEQLANDIRNIDLDANGQIDFRELCIALKLASTKN